MKAKTHVTIRSNSELNLKVGDRVQLTQQIPFGSGCLVSSLVGIVLYFAQAKTGAWFAHSRDKRLWLDRVVIRQDNGEISNCILDQYSRLERPAITAVIPAPIRDRKQNANYSLAISDLIGKPLVPPPYPAA